MRDVDDPDSVAVVARIDVRVFVVPRLVSAIDGVANAVGIMEPFVLLLHVYVPTGGFHLMPCENPVRVQIGMPKRPDGRNDKQDRPCSLKSEA
jgi:hypothetical protein